MSASRSAISAHVCADNQILLFIYPYYHEIRHLNTHFTFLRAFTGPTVANINTKHQRSIESQSQWRVEFVVCRALVSCMLFLPDCHASLWSSWPAQLGRCVFGLSPPSPSSSSSLCHHISCELHRIHPAGCISAVHHLLPALLASSAVQIWFRSFYSVIYIQQKPDCTDNLLPLCPSLPCVVLVLRDCSAQNSDATRWECEQRAAVPEPASYDAVDSCAVADAGLSWSGLRMMDQFLTGQVTEVRHALLPYQMMFSLFRGCYQGSEWRMTLHYHYRLL